MVGYHFAMPNFTTTAIVEIQRIQKSLPTSTLVKFVVGGFPAVLWFYSMVKFSFLKYSQIFRFSADEYSPNFGYT